MFEDKKMRLLNEKLSVLMAKQAQLARSGNIVEANRTLNEINATIAKMDMISQKKFNKASNHLERTIDKKTRQLDKISSKLDQRMANSGFFTPSSKEEDEEALNQIMNGRSR